ncbi:Putative ribonuclease H protein At1g65750 [Linum perenne]
MNFLENIPEGWISHGPPSLSWTLASSGSFSVSSWFKHLIDVQFPGSNFFPFSTIWKKGVPSKICGFLWLLFHGNISTFDNLSKRGFIGPNLCVLCRADLESVSHLFFSCNFARTVWNVFSSKVSIHGPFHIVADLLVEGWQTRNCSREFEKFGKFFLHAFVWFMWGERNGRIFRDEDLDVHRLAWRIAFAMGRWARANGDATIDDFGIWMRLWHLPVDVG